MSKIYVPELNNSYCVVVYNHNTLRVYNTTPEINQSTNYTDYFINSHYLSKTGSEVLTSGVTCLSVADLTTDVYYRNDFDSILVIFFILLLICFYFPYRIISRFFGRWLKW